MINSRFVRIFALVILIPVIMATVTSCKFQSRSAMSSDYSENDATDVSDGKSGKGHEGVEDTAGSNGEGSEETSNSEGNGDGNSKNDNAGKNSGEKGESTANDEDKTDNADGTDDKNQSNDGDKTGSGNDHDDGNKDVTRFESKKVKVKALYLTGWTVGIEERLDHFIKLANETEINAYVIDIKDDDGYVGYESGLPLVQEYGSWMKKYDVDHVLKKMHDNNIHVIGRLVCFKDPVYSGKFPDQAVRDNVGGIWKEYSNGHYVSWINPYKKESWDYLIDIAREALEKGFDEIQFDYVRFPNGKNMNFGEVTQKKYEVINEFLDYAVQKLPGAILSADVFGIICESPEDTENIGQYLEKIGANIDYISPMVYPSHYAVGQIINNVRFEKPDLRPYEVVYNSLVKARNRIASVPNYKADVRPYLQDFTASWLSSGYYMNYGPEQARQQIQAVYDAGYEEWIFWDPSNTYSEEAFYRE